MNGRRKHVTPEEPLKANTKHTAEHQSAASGLQPALKAQNVDTAALQPVSASWGRTRSTRWETPTPTTKAALRLDRPQAQDLTPEAKAGASRGPTQPRSDATGATQEQRPFAVAKRAARNEARRNLREKHRK